GQLPCDTKRILAVEEPAVLLFTGIVHGTDVALEELYIAEHEGRQTGAAAAGALRSGCIERELPGAMLVARDAQITSLANIGAELESVVALDLRPVVDELDLLLVLDQRTVARVDSESVAELEQVIAVVVEVNGARSRVVRLVFGSRHVRRGKERKQLRGRRCDAAGGNHSAGKLRASRRRRAALRVEDAEAQAA